MVWQRSLFSEHPGVECGEVDKTTKRGYNHWRSYRLVCQSAHCGA